MGNTTYSGPVRSEGGFKQISKDSSTGAITDQLTVDSSGNLAQTAGVNNLITDVENVTAATKTLTAADTGTTYLLNRAGGIVITLPTAAAGLKYKFIIGTTFTGTFGIDAAAAVDIFTAASTIIISDKDAPGTVSLKQFHADGSDDDKMTMDADTKGRFVGGVIDCLGIATGGQGSATAVWQMNGVCFGDGTLATPFA
jgi:hypothetical protein|tara:strand:- start:89 stop:682 length:594 start_codon:yes stop_codon:yes gene_type:complete